MKPGDLRGGQVTLDSAWGVRRSAPTDSQTLRLSLFLTPLSTSIISHQSWSTLLGTFFLYKRIRFGGFLFQFLRPEEYATLDPSILFCQRVGRAGPVGLWLSTP
jgi:hypothetical protein